SAELPQGEPRVPHDRHRVHGRPAPFRLRGRAARPGPRVGRIPGARLAPRRGALGKKHEGDAGPVGILLVSHGPLADAFRETVHVLEPDEPEEVGALSLAWDESPEKATKKLEKSIAALDKGVGVVLLTDMFGGTPSNLAIAFLEPGRVEIVSGMNLAMIMK